jgi:hypothetical protein
VPTGATPAVGDDPGAGRARRYDGGVSSRTYRVTVRGMFDQLTEPQRAELLAAAAEHDVFRAEFTEAGNLTYDLAARPFFTFRYLVTATGGAGADLAAEPVSAAADGASAAADWLDEHGYGHKNLRASADGVPEVPQGARARRQARRG